MTLLALFCVPALAQDEPDELDSSRRAAEERLMQQEREFEAAHERMRAMEGRSVEVEVRMREAEHALELAAREVAELSMRQLPRTA
ncbi:MAG: hypothetical protein DRQ63_10705, partial [Gammaproteobacteria bacterium]